MEQKRYGVKTSRLEELKSFQLQLKKKRKIIFNVILSGNVGPPVPRTLITGEGRVSLSNVTYPFMVRREDFIDRGPVEITLVFDQINQWMIRFESTDHKLAFKREISGAWTPSPPRKP